MSDIVIIDSETYDVPVLNIDISADFLDKFAERSADGKLRRELIGVYFNYRITFGQASMTNYALLWKKLTEPVEFHTVSVPDEDGMQEFEAYFSGVNSTLKKVVGSTYYWRDLSVNFIAQVPARTP